MFNGFENIKVSIDMTPVCKKCDTKATKANAGIINDVPYYICRNCKIEVDYMGHEVVPNEDFDSTFEGVVLSCDPKHVEERVALTKKEIEDTFRKISEESVLGQYQGRFNYHEEDED